MNKKLSQVYEKTAEHAIPIFVVIVVCLSAFAIIVNLDDSTGEPETNQNLKNQSDVNVSKYYDNESKVCWSPEINKSNASELKACVSNQTSVS